MPRSNANSPPSKAAKLYTSTPRSRSSSRDNSSLPESPTPARGRFNSRDLPRTYSGQYNESDLIPLECLQQQQFLQSKVSTGVFFCMYLSMIFAMQFASTILTDNILYSWTYTNLIHLVFTFFTIHYSKGSFLVVGEQGELNAMTVWEQLSATPESSTHMRRTLLIVPTIVSYIAVAIVNFETRLTIANGIIWCIAMIPKLDIMNGVRLFGINRTAGIDDELLFGDPDSSSLAKEKDQ